MKPFSAFGAFLFAVIAVAHLVRAIYGWTVTVDTVVVPVWPSVAIFLGAGVLSALVLREARAD